MSRRRHAFPIGFFVFIVAFNIGLSGWALRTCARSDGPVDFEPRGLQ